MRLYPGGGAPYPAGMQNLLIVAFALAVSVMACGKRGVSSKACADYFSKTEACASKTQNKIKADALRQSASVSKQNFEKNMNPMAVEESCKVMAQTLESDPDCK
jgi:hypothetical protein